MVPHAPNFTSAGAASIYSGRYFKGATRFAVPFAIMLLTDIFLGFHKTMPFVYLCLGINVLLGMWAAKKPSVGRILGVTVLASAIFFIVTNFGVWLVAGLYPHTTAGLTACYINAIPFARYTFMGDLIFVGILFGLTEMVKKYQQKIYVKKGEGLWPAQAKR